MTGDTRVLLSVGAGVLLGGPARWRGDARRLLAWLSFGWLA